MLYTWMPHLAFFWNIQKLELPNHDHYLWTFVLLLDNQQHNPGPASLLKALHKHVLSYTHGTAALLPVMCNKLNRSATTQRQLFGSTQWLHCNADHVTDAKREKGREASKKRRKEREFCFHTRGQKLKNHLTFCWETEWNAKWLKLGLKLWCNHMMQAIKTLSYTYFSLTLSLVSCQPGRRIRVYKAWLLLHLQGTKMMMRLARVHFQRSVSHYS